MSSLLRVVMGLLLLLLFLLPEAPLPLRITDAMKYSSSSRLDGSGVGSLSVVVQPSLSPSSSSPAVTADSLLLRSSSLWGSTPLTDRKDSMPRGRRRVRLPLAALAVPRALLCLAPTCVVFE